MSTNCSHDQCEPYNTCVAAREKTRRDDFWQRRARKEPVDQLGTDPLAWLNGDTPGD